MEWTATLQRAIEYMEEHLMEEMNYEDVANSVHISSYEFHRAFSLLTGMTADSYIRNRRLSLAGKEIMETDAKITVEGGKSMDYRMVQTKEQKFITVVRNFSNEIINDESNHDIPDFWQECHEKNRVEPLRELRPAGKRDLYGLCTSTKEEGTFAYGIGVLLDEETSEFDLEEMKKVGKVCFVSSGYR